MRTSKSRRSFLDPRTGLFLLAASNFIAFVQDSLRVEAGWICVLVVLLVLGDCTGTGIRFGLGFLSLLVLQRYVLPASPKVIATSFSIFINYSRRLFPCLMMGTLIVKTVSLREFIVGLRRLHVPGQLIIPICVTLRYFPAIREEALHIRDAMRLRNIRGMRRLEALVVLLMISATQTAEELSAAAVTRGIENPAPKTSLIELRMGTADWCCMGLAAAAAAAACIW